VVTDMGYPASCDSANARSVRLTVTSTTVADFELVEEPVCTDYYYELEVPPGTFTVTGQLLDLSGAPVLSDQTADPLTVDSGGERETTLIFALE
jgi:hypothetical protein